MKKLFVVGILTVTVFLLILSCRSYQVGVAFEPRENSQSIGIAFNFDITDKIENSFTIYPEMYPESSNLSALGLGYDLNYRYPFRVLNSYTLDIFLFPTIGTEFRYLFAMSDYSSQASSLPEGKNQNMGFGVKAGIGMDFYTLDLFFLQGKIFYLPEFSAFGNIYSGFRYNINIGMKVDFW